MPTIDLTDEELAAVIATLRRTIREDKFPMSPRLDPLKAALAKLDPAVPRAAPKPLLPALTAKSTHGKRGLKNR